MIVDCFTFFNELDLLEIRLKELGEVVDRFVLVESTRTFQGKPKPLFFRDNASRFGQFQPKIEHLIVDMPETEDPWAREGFQRDSIKRAVASLPPTAMVFVSDADEIFRSEAMRIAAANSQFAFLEMDLFYYFLDLKDGKWMKPYCAPASEIMEMNDLSLPRWRERLYLDDRNLPEKGSIVESAGWHFSWLGGLPRILSKIDSFSHAELRSWLNEPEKIAAEVAKGERFFATGDALARVDRKVLPACVQKDYRRLARAGLFWKKPWYIRFLPPWK